MRSLLAVLVAALWFVAVSPAYATCQVTTIFDATTGKMQMCTICYGPNGMVTSIFCQPVGE